MNRKLMLGTVIAGLTVPFTLAAQSGREQDVAPAPPEGEVRFEQSIVVTAAHPDLPAEAAFSEREIGAADPLDLGDFVRGQPGLSAARRGPLNLDPCVRGLQEGQLAVLVDGTRTFAAGPGRMDSELSHVGAHAVERMAVVKGPYALTWGGGALSAIRLETRRSPFSIGGRRDEAAAGVGYRANGARGAGWSFATGSSERLRYQMSLDLREGDDYESGSGAKVQGDYRSAGLRAGLGWRSRESLLIEASAGYQEQRDLDYPGRLLDATYFHTRSWALEAAWKPPGVGSLEELSGQLYANRKDHRMNNDAKPTARPDAGRVPPFPLAVDLPTESNTAGGRLQAVGGREDWRWLAGADFYRLDQSATRSVARRDLGIELFRDVVWPDTRIEDAGSYGQLVWAGPEVELAGSVRIDRVEASAGAASEFFRAHTSGPLAADETHWAAALSARLALSEGWLLSAGLGQAMRTASALERYSDRFPSSRFQVAAELLGNPALDPEIARQLDLGLRFARADLSLGLELFYRRIDDYITVVPDPALPRRLPLSPPLVFRYAQEGRAEMRGAELRLEHRAGDWLRWRAAASVLRGEDESFGEPMFGIAPDSLRAGVRIEPRARRWWVDLETTAVARQDRVATARWERPTPGHATVDLRGGVRLRSAWELKLAVENAADREYAHHLNSLDPFTGRRVPEVGRCVLVGVEYRP